VWLRRISKQWVELLLRGSIHPLAGRVLAWLEVVSCYWASSLSSRVVALISRLSFNVWGVDLLWGLRNNSAGRFLLT
jgi:hypothetical protein